MFPIQSTPVVSSSTATGMALKTREDYLLEFEKRLLDILKDLYKTVNYSFALAYGLALLVALVHWGTVEELSFLGSKLKVNGKDVLVFLPFVIAVIYLVTNYELVRIGALYRRLNANGEELVKLNPVAIPITARYTYFYAEGMTGLILSLARLQANRMLKTNPFKFSFPELLRSSFSDLIKGSVTMALWRFYRRVAGLLRWSITLVGSLLVVGCLFYLPIILIAYYNYMEFFYGKPFVFGLPVVSLAALVLTAISTTICGLVLFASYFIDLVESFIKDISVPSNETKRLIDAVELLKALMNLLRFLPLGFL